MSVLIDNRPPKPAPPPIVFDRARLAARLQRAAYGDIDFVTALASEDLKDRLAPINRCFQKAAILGPDARHLPQTAHSAEGPIRFDRFASLVSSPQIPRIDAENLSLPSRDYDLIVSLLDLQVVNDVPGYLVRLRRHLQPDGLLLLAAIGGRSLTELRQAWATADTARHGAPAARVAPFMDVRDAGGLLQRAGFALPVSDVETHRVRYADPLALMHEIKALGASNPMAQSPDHLATPALLRQAIAAYPRDDDGRIGATLEIIWLSGWVPHESQQKPLAPGSAEISLGRVLPDKSGHNNE